MHCLTRAYVSLFPVVRSFLHLARRTPLTFYFGIAMVLLWIITAIAAPLIAPYSASAHDYNALLHGPSFAHLLGTDGYGRDVLSRIIYGGRDVLIIAPASTIISVFLGAILGITSAYWGGWIDEIIMRILDAVMALPIVILAVLILAVLGSSVFNVIIVIALIFSPLIARTARSAALTEVSREYVMASRLLGESTWRIFLFEILPNIRGPLIVEGTIRLAYSVFTAATLGFLGLGVQPPTPDWGLMVGTNKANLTTAPWTVMAPALAIAFIVVAISLITDSLEKMLDL